MTMNTTKQTILKAALPHIRAHSFTLAAIRSGLADHPEAGSKDPEYLLDTLFETKGEAEKELVNSWEDEGIRRMSSCSAGQAEQRQTLKDVLGRRLSFSEESAGEGVVQAHAVIQSPPLRPLALNLPKPLTRIIDTIQGGEKWEAYYPPGEGAGSSTTAAVVAGLRGGERSENSISSASSSSPNIAHPSHPESDPTTTKNQTPHHLPFPLPPNLFRSFGYAWKIADEALHLSAAPFAQNDAMTAPSIHPRTAEIGSTGHKRGAGKAMVDGRDGGKDEVLRMGEGQGWEWYVRRGVLAGIYLGAVDTSRPGWLIIPFTSHAPVESELMRPRPSTRPPTLPLDRALGTLDRLLTSSYEPTVRRLTFRPPDTELELDTNGTGAGGKPRQREVGEGRWKEVGTFGRFVWKSWGGLFRSRGWIA